MTRGQILQQILTERRDRRVAGEAAAYDQMKHYVFARPQLREKWSAWVAEKMAAARAAAKGEEVSTGSAAEDFLRALADTLVKEGENPDRFVYQPLCPHCGDSGMLGESSQRYCSCVLNAAARRMREFTGIREDFTFENYDLNLFPESPLPTMNGTQRELMRVRREQCLSFVNSFPGDGSRSLMLTGGTGLGKTYMLHAIANALVDRGFTVMMVTAYQLVRLALDHSEESGSINSLYYDADLLVIDDLGSEPLYQKITVETLFSLINDRMSRQQPMAFSTNLTPLELNDRYGSRLASRLLDRKAVHVLRLEGEDVRLTKNK